MGGSDGGGRFGVGAIRGPQVLCFPSGRCDTFAQTPVPRAARPNTLVLNAAGPNAGRMFRLNVTAQAKVLLSRLQVTGLHRR